MPGRRPIWSILSPLLLILRRSVRFSFFSLPIFSLSISTSLSFSFSFSFFILSFSSALSLPLFRFLFLYFSFFLALSFFLSLSFSSFLFVPGGFSARDCGIGVVRSLSVVVCSFVATMKYLLKFHSDCFETLSADFLWPS